MPAFPSALAAGYRMFRDQRLPEDRGRLEQLAEIGQAPLALVICCCDSRAAPEAVFSANAGDLFVVRNVANLVPPYKPDGDLHGTSAAIEFALLGLRVPHVVVLGHSRCGGIKAYLQESYDPEKQSEFITPWMKLIGGAREDAVAKAGNLSETELEQAVGEAAIRRSLQNLRTFPEIDRREKAGRLVLHGAYFDIATGELTVLDPDRDSFTPLG